MNLIDFLLVFQLPLQTKYLDLSGNSISFLPNRSFYEIPLLKTLDLSNNGLTKMEINAFTNLGDLGVINLAHNNLDGKFIFYI